MGLASVGRAAVSNGAAVGIPHKKEKEKQKREREWLTARDNSNQGTDSSGATAPKHSESRWRQLFGFSPCKREREEREQKEGKQAFIKSTEEVLRRCWQPSVSSGTITAFFLEPNREGIKGAAE